MTHVLIVDDHQPVLDNLRGLIKSQEPCWDVSEAANGEEALDSFIKVRPDIVVLDIMMD